MLHPPLPTLSNTLNPPNPEGNPHSSYYYPNTLSPINPFYIPPYQNTQHQPRVSLSQFSPKPSTSSASLFSDYYFKNCQPTESNLLSPTNFSSNNNPYLLEDSSKGNEIIHNRETLQLSKTIATKFDVLFFEDHSLIEKNYRFFQQELSFPKFYFKPQKYSSISPLSSPGSNSSCSSLSTLKSSFKAQVVFLPKPNSSTINPQDLIDLVNYITREQSTEPKPHPMFVFNSLLRQALHDNIFRISDDGTFTQVITYEKL